MKNWNARIKLEFSIVLVLLVLIVLFWTFPKVGPVSGKLPSVPAPRIQMVRIPRTIQKMRHQPPPPVRPSVPVPGDDIDMLEEIPLTASTKISGKGQIESQAPLSEENLPYIPRQVVEVLPRVDDLKVHGSVTLKLLIDTQGKVKKYKVLANTTGNPLCVQRVIAAARKSRWEVIQLNDNKVEYWLTKEYRFGE